MIAPMKLLDASFKIVSFLRGLSDARDAEVKLLRMLYLEVSENLEVLDRLRIKDREGLSANDEAYESIAETLEIATHQAVVLMRGEDTDDITRAADAAKAHEEAHATHSQAEARRAEQHEAFRSVWRDLVEDEWELAPSAVLVSTDADGKPMEAPAATSEPAPIKTTTLLKSLAFVVVKTRALVKLCALPDSAEPAQRRVLIATRLEHIRRHERALQRRLEALPAVAPIRV